MALHLRFTGVGSSSGVVFHPVRLTWPLLESDLRANLSPASERVDEHSVLLLLRRRLITAGACNVSSGRSSVSISIRSYSGDNGTRKSSSRRTSVLSRGTPRPSSHVHTPHSTSAESKWQACAESAMSGGPLCALHAERSGTFRAEQGGTVRPLSPEYSGGVLHLTAPEETANARRRKPLGAGEAATATEWRRREGDAGGGRGAGTGRGRASLREDQEAWARVASDVSYMTRTVQLVQWYPGHIAKAERDLREQLKWVDVVLEVRDARIPHATTHPQIDEWIGDRPKLVVVNREDMVTSSDRRAWSEYLGRQHIPFCFTDGRRGAGILKLTRAATAVGNSINSRRKAKGLLPRSVRAAVIGFPNVGKSAIINRLVNRRVCDSAPRPGVTRHVKWVRMGEGLDLLDAPGVLPMRIADQAAAARLAMCNDIGQAAYAVSGVASILVSILRQIPTAGPQVLEGRYKLPAATLTSEEFLEALADKLFMGDVDQASQRVLKDFRSGALGWVALERPPSS